MCKRKLNLPVNVQTKIYELSLLWKDLRKIWTFLSVKLAPPSIFLNNFLQMFKQKFKLYENVQTNMYQFCLLKTIFVQIGD